MSAATPYDNTSLSSSSTEHPPHRNSLDGHSKRVWCVAPLGNDRVVSVSDDNSVIIWNFRTKEQERRWHHEGVMSVAVSHDRQYVVSGSRDGDLQLWDVESGKHFSGPWKLHKDKVWSVTWSPDGSRIASCSEDSEFIIWNARPDLPTGKPFLGPISTKQNAVYAIAYCPMGTKLVTGGLDSTIKIWDAETGLLQVTLDDHTMSVSSVALTRDIVISGSLDCTVRVRDISNSEQKAVSKIITIPDPAAFKHIAVSERFFATASYNCIYLGSLTTYELLAVPFEFPKGDEPNCIALSGDEGTMIVGTERGKVYTWDIREITSAPNELDDNDHIDLATIDDVDNPYPYFFSGGDHESQSGPSLPVKKTRKAILEQIIAPMRRSGNTVVSTATGSKFFSGRLRGRSVTPNGINETAHQPPVVNIERSLLGVAEEYSQATATIDPTQPPSLESPHERAGFWATFKATVRRLLHFRRP